MDCFIFQGNQWKGILYIHFSDWEGWTFLRYRDFFKQDKFCYLDFGPHTAKGSLPAVLRGPQSIGESNLGLLHEKHALIH